MGAVSAGGISPTVAWVLGAMLFAYLLGMYALSLWSKEKIENEEDYLVAGRRLPLTLAWATLLATWFGAGTMLSASEEVRRGGLVRAALDPVGAGLCLVLAGLFFARPLWRMNLLTFADFYRDKFGKRAEVLASLIMVPSYFGWVAAQYLALASVLELFFGVDRSVGLAIVAIVATSYTFWGGMWSVTLTDAVQLVTVIVGLLVLGVSTVASLGGGDLAAGWGRLLAETPAPMLELVPTGDPGALSAWIGVVAVGALGNIPGPDLVSRISASRSETVAQRACLISGVLYFLLGAVPVVLGLASRILIPDAQGRSILPVLASTFLSPAMTVIFVLSLISAVLSTVTSAILAPSGVLAHNLLSRFSRKRSMLALNRDAVLAVAAASLALAYGGQSAYQLLEDAYALPLAGLLVPLCAGIYGRRPRELCALVSMLVGVGLFMLHYVLDWDRFLAPLTGSWAVELPVALTTAIVSGVAYAVAGLLPQPELAPLGERNQA
jgi:SSS family solute:Na+ symporter